jgi:hypothetical protein
VSFGLRRKNHAIGLEVKETVMDNKKKVSCALVFVAALSCAQVVAQSEPAAPARGASPGASQEGIKVHGEWTLTVRNPDGTIAARHEFKNALYPGGGDKILAQLLAGTAVTGQWTIALFASSATACNANNAPCQITENSSPNAANSRDLTRTVPTSGPDAGKLVLRGSVRIPNNATITTVQTELTSCAPTVPAASCVSAFGDGFTQKSLTTGVPVVQDQLVEVKVVISFS